MRIIGESYDGDLNPTGVICEEDGQEYWFEIVRHGRWEWTQNGWCCSVCHKKSMVEAVAFAKYCHRCGAKMDGREG